MSKWIKENVRKNIKNFISYVRTTIKKSRRRTKLAFVLIAFAGVFLINYRWGEFNVPVRVVTKVTGGVDGRNLEYIAYKDGFSYYVEYNDNRKGEHKEYKISRTEYLRCVNKKSYNYKIEDLLRGASDMVHSKTTVTYKNLFKEWEEEGGDVPYSQAIKRLINYYDKKNENDNNKVEIDENDVTRTFNYAENDRILYAWDDLCYKYKVKDSQIIILQLYGEHYDRTASEFFRGYNSDMTKEEYQNRRLGMLEMNKNVLGISNFFGWEELVSYAVIKESKPELKTHKRALNILNNAYQMGTSNNIYKAQAYMTQEHIEKRSSYSKTFAKKDEVVHICADNEKGIAVAVLLKTDDYLTRGFLTREMDSIVKNGNKDKVLINMYILVRVFLLIIIEWLVFVVIGKRRKKKQGVNYEGVIKES